MRIAGRIMILLISASASVLPSCVAPVLNRQLMDEGAREVSFEALREHPDQYTNSLFVFGGVIVRTKLTAGGAQFEALHVPVDRSGYFLESGRSEGRLFALLPPEMGMADPVIYHKGRRFTIAADFIEIRKGRIDEMEYGYPVFRIRQLYLWPQERAYVYPPLYLYDPWFYPYPYYYRHAWWYYPHRHAPAPIRQRTVTPVRRVPAPEHPLR
ncbi:MAG TPA: Slp family lipoprotein [Nitrospirota bacterium]|nr:Slp family lipoprotein [Nitrospirota bacterium]